MGIDLPFLQYWKRWYKTFSWRIIFADFGASKIRMTRSFLWYSWMAFILLDVVILTPQKSERTATLTVALHFDILFGSKIMTNITGNPCITKIPSKSNDVKNRCSRFRSNLWSAISPLVPPTCSHWDLNLVWKPGCWLSIPQIDLTNPQKDFGFDESMNLCKLI